MISFWGLYFIDDMISFREIFTEKPCHNKIGVPFSTHNFNVVNFYITAVACFSDFKC